VIETEKQRRWWFATHPEYSWSSKGTRARGQRYGQSSDNSAAIGVERDKDREERERIAKDLELWRQSIERDKVGLEADPHTALDLFPFRKLITSPIAALRNLFWSSTQHTILSAARREANTGPGKWVEAHRGWFGLEHQSTMSGQPIRKSGLKNYIYEYEVNGVKFDDYRDGILYEYKGNYSNFIVKKVKAFYSWFRGANAARDQALRQTKAAQGVPIVWRVGSQTQVDAFEKALGEIPGVDIRP
jgi:hypothetical protein